MKINYGLFHINGTLLKESMIEINSKNQYSLYNLYDKFSLVDIDWYTTYDLSENKYAKYKLSDNSFIKEGIIRGGEWKADQLVSTFEFLSHEQYMGYNGIKFTEFVDGQVRNQYEIQALHNSFVSHLIDKEYISLLPISSSKMLGSEYEEFEIIASRYWISQDRHCLFKIKDISH